MERLGRGFGLPPDVIPQLTGQGEDQAKMARALFAAIVAAGSSTCTCQVCKLMKKVSEAMVSDLLKEETGGPD